ncbi:MAG: tyrosine-type recombinase/integrase [Fusobacteria bacterium]|nr:tyrosine-type recombinase/integrase [Fusobacteriota bacterium]
MKHERLDYLDYITFEKGLSQNTIDSYRRDIIQFETYLATRNIVSWNEITVNILGDYSEHLSASHKRASCVRKITTLKNLFQFLYINKIITVDIGDHLKNIKREKLLFDALTPIEIEKIMGAIGSSLPEKRDKMIIELLLFTGARISEVIDLAVEDLDFEGLTLRFMAKGSQQRILPITDYLADKLKHYLLEIRHNLKEKNHYKVFNIDRKYFWVRLQKYGQMALGKAIHPHLFRHTVATELLSSGANIRIVQELLGHKSIATTQVYTHVDKKKIKKLYESVDIGDE